MITKWILFHCCCKVIMCFWGPLLGVGRLCPSLLLFCSPKVNKTQNNFELHIPVLGTALIIPPLVTIQSQMVGVCETWGIKHLDLSSISVKTISKYIEAEKPQILISSIEMISNVDVQKELSSLSLDYIALDEAQVQDLIILGTLVNYF